MINNNIFMEFPRISGEKATFNLSHIVTICPSKTKRETTVFFTSDGTEWHINMLYEKVVKMISESEEA